MHKFEEQLQVLFNITRDLTLLSRNKRSLRKFCFNLNILLLWGILSKLLITISGISNITEYAEKLNSKSNLYLGGVDYACLYFVFKSAVAVLILSWEYFEL